MMNVHGTTMQAKPQVIKSTQTDMFWPKIT